MPHLQILRFEVLLNIYSKEFGAETLKGWCPKDQQQTIVEGVLKIISSMLYKRSQSEFLFACTLKQGKKYFGDSFHE